MPALNRKSLCRVPGFEFASGFTRTFVALASLPALGGMAPNRDSGVLIKSI